MKLYGKFLAMHMKSSMAYKSSFFMACIGQLLIGVNLFLGVWFMMDRFGSVQGYTMAQLSLCCAVILMASSLAECFGRGFDAFGSILAQAEFDRILVRPRNLVFQVLCQRFKNTMLPRLAQSAVMLAWAIHAGAVHWTPAKAVVLVLMIVCGAAVFFGVFLVYAAVCFYTLEGLEVLNIFTDAPREYGKYPFGVYGKGVLYILTFLVPLALVQHWPLQYLLDRGPGWYCALPLAALVFLIPCMAAWRLGLRHYTSTGS